MNGPIAQIGPMWYLKTLADVCRESRSGNGIKISRLPIKKQCSETKTGQGQMVASHLYEKPFQATDIWATGPNHNLNRDHNNPNTDPDLP